MVDDVRYAARALGRAPGFTIVAVVTLALGIGANAAVFTVANSVLIKTLPYADPDRLMSIQFRAAGAARSDASVPSPALAVWTAQSRALESVAAYSLGETGFAAPSGEPLRVMSAAVSPSLFAVLGVTGVRAGRPFKSEDAVWGSPRVAIVSHQFWRDRLGGAEDLTALRLGGTVVVGVLSESFRFPDVIAPDVLMPLALPPGDAVASLRTIGRLRPGASLEAAESELRQIVEAAGRAFPAPMAARMQRGDLPHILPLQQHLAGNFRALLITALGVAAVILLMACANVAGLLQARAKGRERELAIRIALGGTPMRLARLFLTESMMLAAMGAVAALLTTAWSMAALRHALVGTAPHAESIALDVRVAAFALLAALLSTLFCAAIPISRLFAGERRWDWKFSPASAGRFGGRHAAGRALVMVQVSGAMVLLIGALLLQGTLWRLSSTNVGFDARNVLTLRVPGWLGNWPRPREAALDEILRRIQVLPGVVSAAATTSFPLDGHAFGMGIFVDNQPPSPVEEPGIGVDVVSPGYFHTMGIRLLSGRTFDDRDTSSAPRVAIVNAAFVRWKNLNTAAALERRISMGGGPQYAAKDSKWSIEIVGVVDDVLDVNPGDEPRPIVYRPFTQAAPNIGWGTANIVVRTASDPADVSERVRQAIQSVVTRAVVHDVQPMEQRMASLLAPQRQRAIVFGLFGVTAVVLAVVGLYGLLAYVVSQEMREFGIRLAIGASRGSVARLALRRGLVSVAIGLAVGLVSAQLLTRQLAAMLYGVTAADPGTYAAAIAIMLAVAATASYVPVRRAMRADPVAVLRSE